MKMKAISAVMNATYNPHICYWVLIFCYICFLPSQDTKILKNRSIWTDLVVCFVKKVLIYFYFATGSHCYPTSFLYWDWKELTHKTLNWPRCKTTTTVYPGGECIQIWRFQPFWYYFRYKKSANKIESNN